MVKTIFLRQVLAEIEKVDALGNTQFHEIEFMTFNRNNKTGGKRTVYTARLLKENKLKGKVFNPMEHDFRSFRSRKNPNHWDNVTRNFELKTSGLIRKVIVRYITKFNGVEVAY